MNQYLVVPDVVEIVLFEESRTLSSGPGSPLEPVWPPFPSLGLSLLICKIEDQAGVRRPRFALLV